MDLYLTVKVVHIISATILFGTGLGIAFFTFRSHFTGNLDGKLFALKTTVLADYLFTLPAVVLQPATGAWLIWQGSYGWTEMWLVATYVTYAIAGACWLPVVWIQIQLKHMLADALRSHAPLPPRYTKLFRIWFALGWPAFIGLVVVFFLMVFKPVAG